MKRINTLDYLRGLTAFSIMIYHLILFSPTPHKFDVSGFIERIAIYGVSIFYILSGLTLYLIYRNYKFSTYSDYILFFKKRVLRILPLFGIVTLYVFITKGEFSPGKVKTLFLNISGLFSILSWNKYIITGGWSIGNELFFYIFFPFMVILTHKKKTFFWLCVFLSFLIYCYFSYFIIKPELPLSKNWSLYINPLNQLFLFNAGIVIGYLSYFQPRNLSYILLLSILIGLFIFFPIQGDFPVIMAKNNRLIFTFIVIAIVYCSFRIQFIKFKPIDFVLKTLGEISYGIYLIHAIVFEKIKSLFLGSISLEWIILLTIILSIVISYLSYHYFEMKIIRRFTKKANN